MPVNDSSKCPFAVGSQGRKPRGRMYGILFESIQFFVTSDYGKEAWEAVLEHSGLPIAIFIAQKTYPDSWMVSLAKSTHHVLQVPSMNDVMFYFGTCFVNYCCRVSYDKILRNAGRTYRDFLNEIDNIHENIRFSHPKMQSPSFIVQAEDRDGCVLVYRSMRTGFTYYVMGQLWQCAKQFYEVNIKIKVLEELISDKGCNVTFRLNFDNQAFTSLDASDDHAIHLASYPKVRSETFFELFPFCLVFNSKMRVIGCGGRLAGLMQSHNPRPLGASVGDIFHLRRPLVDFTWNNIMTHQRVVFEMALRKGDKDGSTTSSCLDGGDKTTSDGSGGGAAAAGGGGGGSGGGGGGRNSRRGSGSGGGGSKNVNGQLSNVRDGGGGGKGGGGGGSVGGSGGGGRAVSEKNGIGTKKLLLRGQMKFIKDWDAIAFLCTPILSNIDEMQKMGMYLQDLSVFDNSRDLVWKGQQCASDIEYNMERQMAWTKQIEATLTKLGVVRQKSEDLINSMLTKSIADRLKSGVDALDTCESFSQVTILFSYLVEFPDICTDGTPFQVIQCVQNATQVFDKIVDKHQLFKVETLGDGVYMVAGGVPDRCEDHAQRVAGLALDLLENVGHVKNPITDKGMQLLVGMHTGSVVAGIVGKRTPQYCLFGDTVNTAARMQTNSVPGRIHLTQPCHLCLQGTQYATVYRGRLPIKGKGEMRTYWLVGRKGEASTKEMCNMLMEEHFTRLRNGSVPAESNSRPRPSAPRVYPSMSSFDTAAADDTKDDERRLEESIKEILLTTQGKDIPQPLEPELEDKDNNMKQSLI